jgi:hypothetical protein
MAMTPADQLAAALARHQAIGQAAAAESERIAAERERDAARQLAEQGLKPPTGGA